MQAYRAPISDTNFVLNELLNIGEVLPELKGYEEFCMEDFQLILDEAARFCESEIHPINQLLDEQGCRLEDGRVMTPDKLKKAWAAFAEAGWPSLICDSEHGGQGLPYFLYFAVQEYISSASIAFGDYAGLNVMAYILLRTHANEDLKARYLPGLAEGTLAATMCMTEPHCGTDVGLIKTRAQVQEDGTYLLTGTKIFISGGDHDLTGNIVHTVLARVSGAAPGPKGLSLFLVPKILPENKGELNSVTPVSLENKMGYKGSATCQMAFDNARGWRIGEEGKGLNCMFVMVNLARLMTASQGLCAAELAYQNAAAYAVERLQGRALSGPQFLDKPADPIIVHPDVRRMLMSTRAFTEVARAIYLWMAMEIDISQRHGDEERRQRAADRLALFTPVVKATLSDFGFNACNDCMQIFGGHGYIRENGMEQLVRDVRLSQIQEGANGILALDLIQRRVFGRQSQAYQEFVDNINQFIEINQDAVEFTEPLAEILTILTDATSWLETNGKDNPDAYGASGTEYQRLFGLTLFAWFWARMAVLASCKARKAGNTEFFEDKLSSARFFMQRILPMAHGHLAVLQNGADTIMKPAEHYFNS
jgi:alkylation response protein AidB-like acyl-CoA dehydrogenase